MSDTTKDAVPLDDEQICEIAEPFKQWTIDGYALFDVIAFARAIEQASRRAALEEAAKVCDERALNFRDNLRSLTCEACANAIRALSKGETE